MRPRQTTINRFSQVDNIINYRINKGILNQNDLVRDINNQLGIALDTHISLQELRLRLAEYVNLLVREDFQQLVRILYRVDVNEQSLKKMLQEKVGEDAGLIIASMLIERQLQKIKTRQQTRRPPFLDDGEAERW